MSSLKCGTMTTLLIGLVVTAVWQNQPENEFKTANKVGGISTKQSDDVRKGEIDVLLGMPGSACFEAAGGLEKCETNISAEQPENEFKIANKVGGISTEQSENGNSENKFEFKTANNENQCEQSVSSSAEQSQNEVKSVVRSPWHDFVSSPWRDVVNFLGIVKKFQFASSSAPKVSHSLTIYPKM